MTTSSAAAARVAKKLQAYGQSHVLKYVDELSEAESQRLFQQVDALDLDLVREAHAFATRPDQGQGDKVQPLPSSHIFSVNEESSHQEQEWRHHGLLQIAAGRVGAILLAGGQGTRLGFAGPKGSYNPGLLSNKTLFQLSVERLQKVKHMASATSLPLYILTSESNDADTRQFFADHGYFGLDRGEIFFFTQGMLPCVTLQEGLLMLEKKHQLAMSPDGNGGLFAALDKSGALADMQRRGVDYVHVMAIDNPQNLPGDPVFVGLCAKQQVEAGNLCIPKLHPQERVGVCALRNGAFHVVEYTETLSAGAGEGDGEWTGQGANLANICNHVFSVRFLVDKVLPGMKALHHQAIKTIPTVEDANSKGVKLELFIFDAFPFATRYLALSSPRRSENFAPIKNAEGDDSPATCRALVQALHHSWLVKAGAELVGDGPCEISPLVSVDGAGLDKLVAAMGGGAKLVCPLVIESGVPGVPGVPVDVDAFGKSEWRLQVDLAAAAAVGGVTRYRVVPATNMAASSDKKLRETLAGVDVDNTTPVDALVKLRELKKLAEN